MHAPASELILCAHPVYGRLQTYASAEGASAENLSDFDRKSKEHTRFFGSVHLVFSGMLNARSHEWVNFERVFCLWKITNVCERRRRERRKFERFSRSSIEKSWNTCLSHHETKVTTCYSTAVQLGCACGNDWDRNSSCIWLMLRSTASKCHSNRQKI